MCTSLWQNNASFITKSKRQSTLKHGKAACSLYRDRIRWWLLGTSLRLLWQAFFKEQLCSFCALRTDDTVHTCRLKPPDIGLVTNSSTFNLTGVSFFSRKLMCHWHITLEMRGIESSASNYAALLNTSDLLQAGPCALQAETRLVQRCLWI